MPTSLPQRRSLGWRSAQDTWIAASRWNIAAFCVPVIAMSLAFLLPAPLILPVLSIVLLTAGFGLAIANYVAARRGGVIRDLAGALVLFGFAAALMCDAEQALIAFAELDAAFADRLAVR
jgi:cobalamin synthase